MKVNYYVLRNRDVAYIKEEIDYTSRRAFGDSNYVVLQKNIAHLLRVENIDGKLNVTLLPTEFEKENGALELTVNPHTSIQLAASDSCSDFIVKQGRAYSELGMYLLEEANSERTTSTFADYATIVASANNYKPNAMEFMMNLYSEAFELANEYPSNILPTDIEALDPYNIILTQQFDYLAKNRKNYLEQASNKELVNE